MVHDLPPYTDRRPSPAIDWSRWPTGGSFSIGATPFTKANRGKSSPAARYFRQWWVIHLPSASLQRPLVSLGTQRLPQVHGPAPAPPTRGASIVRPGLKDFCWGPIGNFFKRWVPIESQGTPFRIWASLLPGTFLRGELAAILDKGSSSRQDNPSGLPAPLEKKRCAGSVSRPLFVSWLFLGRKLVIRLADRRCLTRACEQFGT
jgi:hypothetical protein